jgi:hypothetical protein
MDKIAPALCIFFGMILYWNIRHINQNIVRWTGDKYTGYLSLVFNKMKELRDCMEKETASRILAELKTLLNMDSKNGISNSFYGSLM